MATPERKPYRGLSRKLVIAFDIGTTFSGASFAILDPDEIPKIQGVTRFPAQAKTGGDCKIPSIIYYDQEGNVQAVGAETADEAFLERAEDENYIKVEWFKLHLRPKGMNTSDVQDSDLPPLPPNKTALRVFADFLKYLYENTIKYIQELGPLYKPGSEFWNSVKDNIELILSHPNGWEGSQQSIMRRATVLAGLVTEESSLTALHFVTEGEASLHFCVMSGKASTLGNSGGLIVVDAGGGTIDISAYYSVGQESFEEVARTRCLLQGSVYVSRRAEAHLKQKLANSKYSSNDDVKQITQVFDKTTKLVFRDRDSPAFIRFGTAKDRDPSVDIRNGQLKLAGNVVEEFFEPSLKQSVQAIKDIQEESSRALSTVLLVGGFAANEWLFMNLQRELAPLNMTLSRPDGHVNKAVADGALSFYLDHFVSVRVSKYTYGIECATQYIPSNPEHNRRSHSIVVRPSGKRVVPGSFSRILAKGTRIHEEKEFSRSYYQESGSIDMFRSVIIDVMSYRGNLTNPEWIDTEPHMYTTLCTVVADASKAVKPNSRGKGSSYYTVDFKMILLLGLTEMKAQLSWMEDGVEKRSPAKVVYDDMSMAR
ncbi:hypothetical protein K435DRAFT_781211 [Dendrothele bispora CBS 962.96]|uniref:Actin-like ATPase domain-containing protein n=1 Tax=Dendrothele bispora (strain CBS 962.96) TaxID=1314807 RepID=A0A4S8LMF0_DENBC|nr:hypothetical protein K435DRAFT_781211 [Dendrothele bispora CBS 962.96]